MSRWYTLVDQVSGEIVGRLTSTADALDANVPAGLVTIEGCFDAADGYVAAGEFVPYSAEQRAAKALQPSVWHRWDNLTMTWNVADADRLAALLRAERAQRLADCDWTQQADCPLSATLRAAWVAYRQALRDVSLQAGWPGIVLWPTPPSDV